MRDVSLHGIGKGFRSQIELPIVDRVPRLASSFCRRANSDALATVELVEASKLQREYPLAPGLRGRKRQNEPLFRPSGHYCKLLTVGLVRAIQQGRNWGLLFVAEYRVQTNTAYACGHYSSRVRSIHGSMC